MRKKEHSMFFEKDGFLYYFACKELGSDKKKKKVVNTNSKISERQNMDMLIKGDKPVKIEKQSVSIKIENESVHENKGKIENKPKHNSKSKIENRPIYKRKVTIVRNPFRKDYKQPSLIVKVMDKVTKFQFELCDFIGIKKLIQMYNLLSERVWKEQPSVTKKQRNTLTNEYGLSLEAKNDKVLHFNNQNLNSYDIANCLPKSWFNGHLIDFFNVFFSSSQFHRNISKAYPNHLKQEQYFIERTFSTIVLEECKDIMEAENLDKQTKRELCYNLFYRKLSYVFKKNLYDITKISYLILPLNHKRNHWKVFIIEGINEAYHEIRKGFKTEQYDGRLESIVYFYALDSVTKQEYDLKLAYRILNQFVNFLIFGQLEKDYPDYIQNKFSKGHHFVTDEDWQLCIVDVPQQTNEHDCGPLSLENIEHFILYGKEVIHEEHYFFNRYDPNQMSLKRKALLNLLVSLQKQYKFEVS